MTDDEGLMRRELRRRPVARPRLALLSTGGTIAMTAQDGVGAKVAIDAAALARSAGVYDAEIMVRDVLALPSPSLSIVDLGRLAKEVRSVREACDGVVITHGTDTLEETAFALSLLLEPEGAPIVLTAAMRRSDQLGADGPANLAAALRLAASASARDLGVVVVSGDEIHCGALVRKVHSFRPQAFSSAPYGPIGWIAEGRVRIMLRPAFSLPLLTYRQGAPIVAILDGGAGLEPQVVAALDGSVDGLVVAAAGAGHVSKDAVPSLAALAGRVPVIFASRTGGGGTLRSTYGFAGGEIDLISRGLIPAGPLEPRKARILLQLLLANAMNIQAIRATFDAL